MNAPAERGALEQEPAPHRFIASTPIEGKPHVLLAIRDVQAWMAKIGIPKLRKADTSAGGFAFRSIDDLYNELCGVIADAYLVAVPNVLDHKQQIGKTGSGKPMMMTTVRVRYDFYSAKDGSRIEACTVGEGFDMSDKSSNKSMSGAHKYALIQVFHLPLVGKDDGDNDDNRLGADKATTPKGGSKGGDPATPKGKPDTKGDNDLIPEPTNVDPAVTVEAMKKALATPKNEEHLRKLFAKYQDSIKKWASYSSKQRKNWIDMLVTAKEEGKERLAVASGPATDPQGDKK